MATKEGDGLRRLRSPQAELKDEFRHILRTAPKLQVERTECRVEVKPGKFVQAHLQVPTGGADVALVCTHPWAVMGGDMHNNVPSFIADNFAALGLTTIKFDFRSGLFSRGYGELDDVRCLCL